MPQSSEPTKAIRILHIGNIANNAYLNAKILNERGFECVVAAPDYTHIMGCPEWEDADFHTLPEDQNDPDWSKIDLQGFVRPDWFVNEPLLRSLITLSGEDSQSPIAIQARRRESIRGLLRRIRDGARPIRWVVNRILKYLSRYRTVNRIKSRLFAMPGGTSATPSGNSLPAQALVPDGVEAEDVVPWNGVVGSWQAILEQYDLVIGYGLDGLLPLICGRHPYLAFEHGTIRAFPFEDTPRGRLCAATYREADGVFVTNCDNRIAAERLGLKRYRFIPHPVNERLPESGGVSELRQSIQDELQADFLVFHPSRQHWEPEVRSPNWEKGNDVLIRGFAKAATTNSDVRFGLIMVRWGQTLDATYQLLDELGISDRVKWIDPLPHLRMSEMILACDAVADQFYLGAFGSLTPKGLMLGRPVLLKLDEDLHDWAFDEMPPVMNTATPSEVADALANLTTDPRKYAAIAESSRDWYQRHHSNERIARILIEEIEHAAGSRTIEADQTRATS